MPLRLLSVFPSFVTGGAQMRFVALANHFRGAVAHGIVPLDGRHEAAMRLDPALDVSILAPDRPARRNPVSAVSAARRSIAAFRPDVLLTSNWGSIEWAGAGASCHCRRLHTEDGFGPEERDRQLPRRVWARRLALRRTSVILPSRTLERIARDRWRLPTARLHYVPNGIDLDRFDCQERDERETVTIGTVAALRAEKAIGRLLDAFAAVRAERPARLVIVGDGPERTALEQQAARLGLAPDVRFAGATSTPETHYAKMDIFALSSDTEQMPLSVLEAMAARLPVAATDVGDVRAMLPPANAPFVVPRNAEDLATALLALARDPAQRTTLGTANRARAEAEFSFARMAARWAALLGVGE